MAKYRKIPIIVDAIQYTGELKPAKDFLGIKDAVYDSDSRTLVFYQKFEDDPELDYTMIVELNNWILKHEDGSFEVNTEEEFKEYEILNEQ